MASEIIVPPGSNIRLVMSSPDCVVIVAPPGIPVEIESILKAKLCCGMFTFDDGVTWPDRVGYQYATAYLQNSWPCMFAFSNVGDALEYCKQLMAAAKTGAAK